MEKKLKKKKSSAKSTMTALIFKICYGYKTLAVSSLASWVKYVI